MLSSERESWGSIEISRYDLHNAREKFTVHRVTQMEKKITTIPNPMLTFVKQR